MTDAAATRRGDGIGLEVTSATVRGVRLAGGTLTAAVEIGIGAPSTDRSLVDALVIAHAELDAGHEPTRLATFSPGATLQRRDVTGLTGVELNTVRHGLSEQDGIGSTMIVDDGPRRWLMVIGWDDARVRHLEQLGELAGFADVAVEPSPMAMTRTAPADVTRSMRVAAPAEAFAVVHGGDGPIAAASVDGVGITAPELAQRRDVVSPTWFDELLEPPLLAAELTHLGIAEVGGSYAFGDRDASLRIGQTLYSHFYTDHGIFDQLVNRTWAQARKQISSAISADLRYTFEFAWADWSQFRQTHAVEPGLSFQISNEMFVRAFFRYESREFFIPVTLAAFDRDGEINRGGADLFYSLPADWLWGSSWVRAGYRFREENSDGSQFRSGGHVPVLTISLALPARLILNLDGRIEWRKYDVASLVDPSVGIREDHIGRLRTAVLRPLTDHLTLELSHVWTDRTSNVNSFDYQRHELSLLATYQY